MNEVNELFTKENVEKIYVPDIVKDDLLSIIEEKLKKAGFYYRVAYRVKAPDSMLDKLILKDYRRPGTENQDKKMQDLIGIRIILYYADDVEIVRIFLIQYSLCRACGIQQRLMNMSSGQRRLTAYSSCRDILAIRFMYWKLI